MLIRVCPYCRSKRIDEPNSGDARCKACGKHFVPVFALEVDESMAKS